MPKYRIPVSWEMYGRVTIEAENVKEAIEKAWSDDIGLDKVEDAEYVSASWEVDEQVALEEHEEEEDA